MKKATKIVLLLIATIIGTGIIWWQANKKSIVKNKIKNAVSKGTDSTYYIHYDSSKINAAEGNATFYNVVLQSDSLQKKLYSNDTNGIAAVIFNVHIKRITVLGVNIPSFLQKNKIEANAIEIEEPEIKIISTGKNAKEQFTKADTLALYEKITGKFKSVQAGSIKIISGNISFAKGKAAPHILLQGINISLNNLKIDSTKNYDNIISYFVKDIVANVKTTTINNEKQGRILTFENVEYNAPGRFLKVQQFSQTDIAQNKKMIELNNNKVSGLSTNAFIINRQLKADSLTTDGGMLGFYQGKNEGKKKQTLEIDYDFFDEALVKNIRIGSTTLSLYNKANKKEAPLVLKNAKFSATDIDSIYNGTNIMRLIGSSKWDLSADGVSFFTADKIYKISAGPFLLDSKNSIIKIKEINLTPVQSQETFIRNLKFQKDYYNLAFKNILLTGADVKKLVTDKKLIAATASVEPVIKIFNDRTVPPDTSSKMGKYPYQMLQKMQIPIYIKTVKINNGFISYKERGAISKKVGNVFFTGVNATLSNITNIDNYLQKNKTMRAIANCSFLNAAPLSSAWVLPLTAANENFTITGKLGAFSGPLLNPVIEPLGMGSVKSGNITSLNFSLNGDDFNGKGEVILLYDNLKIKLLKATESNGLKNKTLPSIIANIIIRDKNPSNGNTRKGNMAFKRVMSASFFNLVWKSIFAGVKDCVK